MQNIYSVFLKDKECLCKIMVFHHLLGGDVRKKKTCKPNSKWFLHPFCAGSTQKGLAISISLGCEKCACLFLAVFDFAFAS